MKLLPVYRCKYTAKANVESTGLYNFWELLLVFDDPDARDRKRTKRDFEIFTNAYFLSLNHVEGLMSVEQSIKSKTSQAIISENNAVIMLNCPGNRSNALNMQKAEPLFQFCHTLPTSVAINTPQ